MNLANQLDDCHRDGSIAHDDLRSMVSEESPAFPSGPLKAVPASWKRRTGSRQDVLDSWNSWQPFQFRGQKGIQMTDRRQDLNVRAHKWLLACGALFSFFRILTLPS